MRVTDSFDFGVVGGGSGGCAVAGRLSEDPKTAVALLEAGGKDDNWMVTTPGALALMVPSKLNNWAFDTVPQAGLNGRIGYQPRGKGLGGSSAINAMVYIRGHRRDYDQWPSLGNAGWSYADVLPYFTRSEDNADFGGEYHGKGGPLAVNKLRTDNPVQQTFLQAAREAQFRIREDFNAEDHEGLGLSGDAEKRRTLERGAGLCPPLYGNARQSARRDQCAGQPHSVRRQARGRGRIPPRQGAVSYTHLTLPTKRI